MSIMRYASNAYLRTCIYKSEAWKSKQQDIKHSITLLNNKDIVEQQISLKQHQQKLPAEAWVITLDCWLTGGLVFCGGSKMEGCKGAPRKWTYAKRILQPYDLDKGKKKSRVRKTECIRKYKSERELYSDMMLCNHTYGAIYNFCLLSNNC